MTRSKNIGIVPTVSPETAFRRAMIATCPNYFSWDRTTQERYRLTLNKEARLRIKQEILKSLFDLSASGEKEIEDALDTFDSRRYLLFNSAMLLVQGIGDDLFFLNDYLGKDRTLADFETLGAYDYDDYCFQEKTLTEASPERATLPYQGTLYGTWARMLIDGKFFYASLWMASMHVGSVLDDWGQDRIRELIPHRYIRGKDDGKRESGGTLLDLRVDANGQEAQLEELQSRYYPYVIERRQALANTLDKEERGQVYLLEDSRENDPHMRFIFTDKAALQKVHFCRFVSDCRKISGNRKELQTLEEQEKSAAAAFIDSNFRDIEDNFDPSIVQFRRKRKILLADGALDGLEKDY